MSSAKGELKQAAVRVCEWFMFVQCLEFKNDCGPNLCVLQYGRCMDTLCSLLSAELHNSQFIRPDRDAPSFAPRNSAIAIFPDVALSRSAPCCSIMLQEMVEKRSRQHS